MTKALFINPVVFFSAISSADVNYSNIGKIRELLRYILGVNFGKDIFFNNFYDDHL